MKNNTQIPTKLAFTLPYLTNHTCNSLIIVQQNLQRLLLTSTIYIKDIDQQICYQCDNLFRACGP